VGPVAPSQAKFFQRAAPWVWALGAFGLYFYYARFIPQIGWNAIELIIAQHLIEHGVYATSLDYPSALTWRPVVPTLVVALFRLVTSDPLLIYQLVCGTALATLTGAMFASARLLWNTAAGHVAAFLSLTCPAITCYLIDHIHSYSHIVTLMALGPAIYFSLRLIRKVSDGETASIRAHAAAGFAWGVCYLCRSELLLFFAALLAALVLTWFRRSALVRLGALVGGFLLLFLPYNFYAEHIAQRDGLLIRKTIYGMYISQGWADPPPDVGPDIEGDGYRYAIQLYGDPKANDESLVRAIRNNVPAFQRRVLRNAGAFYERFSDATFLPRLIAVSAGAMLVLLLIGATPATTRRGFLFLVALFGATHFVLLFHIDPRYLSIGVPPLLLLATGALVWAGQRLTRLRPLPRAAAIGLAAIALLMAQREPLRRIFQHREANTAGIVAMKSFGDHFRAAVPAPKLHRNREPHVAYVAPPDSPLYGEDPIMLGYFTRTAWVNTGAEGPFPRGRFYSYRDCEDDYRYVPAAQYHGAAPDPSVRLVSEYDNPVLGGFCLLELHP
jgi:hypothetical protein